VDLNFDKELSKLSDWINEHKRRLQRIYNTKVQNYDSWRHQARTAVNQIKDATNIEQYKTAYNKYLNIEKTLHDNGCVHPLPPMTKVLDTTIKPVELCHKAYLLGYKIAANLNELKTQFSTKGIKNDHLADCLKNYAAYLQLKDTKNASIDGNCFDKGRRDG